MTATDTPKPLGLALDLRWEGELRFHGSSGASTLVRDSKGLAGPSPVQALAFALGGCMGIDVVHILTRGRHALTGLSAHLDAERSPTDPKRLLAVRLHFKVQGAVPPEAVERALALSRDTYCSVWQSLRQDIDFRTSFELTGAP
jgi:putative redox protein